MKNPNLWLAIAVALAARVALTLVWPPDAFSCDLKAWQLVTASTLVGVNPYVHTVVLNWPPLWMEILYALGKLSNHFDWQIFTTIRLFLTAADAVLIASTFALLRLLDDHRRGFRLILIGLCLNPLLLLLTIQQGNFDVLPTIGIVWFIHNLIRFRRSGDALDWLIAAAALGLAVFAKTFPLVLAPLLAAEARRLPWKVRLTGLALLLAPTALSLTPLYVLNPERIHDIVFFYRGTPGPMGVAGLLQFLFGFDSALRYAPYFTLALAAALLLLTAILWLRPLPTDSDVPLLAAIILMAIFTLGSGYCPQYWMWVTPLLLVAYPVQPPGFRRLLLVAAGIVVLTNVLTFGYENILGNFLVYLAPHLPWNAAMVRAFSDTMHDLVLISLPMTLVTLWVILQAAWLIARRQPSALAINRREDSGS